MSQTIRKTVAGMLLALVSWAAHGTAYELGVLSPGDSGWGAAQVVGNFSDTWAFQLGEDGSTLSSAVALSLSGAYHITDGEYGLYSGTVGNGTELGSWSFNGTSGDTYHLVSLMSSGPYYFLVSGLADGKDGGLYTLSVTAPIPEPETYALLLAGLALVGFVARRRKGIFPAQAVA